LIWSEPVGIVLTMLMLVPSKFAGLSGRGLGLDTTEEGAQTLGGRERIATGLVAVLSNKWHT
jgi:hypothetical protein